MNKMRMVLVALMLMTCNFCQILAWQQDEKIDLETLYRQIDEAIEESPQYVANRKAQIEKQRLLLQNEKEMEQRFLIAEELFALYKPFKNDSALHYAQVCIVLADSLHRPDLSGRYHSLVARQCSNASMYVESLEQLRQVDKSALDRQGLTDYYDAWMHVCGEVAAYSLIPEVKARYYALQDHYRDSVLSVADQGSDEYFHLQMSALCARKQFQEALKVSDRWLNKVSEGTHADAYAAYYRHIVYASLGNAEMVRFWLAKSALDDIKCAVMDQASLITLAEQLDHDGDVDRSYRYIRFTWQCNNFFNTRLRSSQITPVLNVIEKSYQDNIERNTRFLIIASVVFTLLSLLLFYLFSKVHRQKKHLAKAHSDLMAVNEKLEKTNKKLTWMNERVMKNNKQLMDINSELQKEKDSHADSETLSKN